MEKMLGVDLLNPYRMSEASASMYKEPPEADGAARSCLTARA